jgi:hypothetical protein
VIARLGRGQGEDVFGLLGRQSGELDVASHGGGRRWEASIEVSGFRKKSKVKRRGAPCGYVLFRRVVVRRSSGGICDRSVQRSDFAYDA